MNELKQIIKQICIEKGISEESVYETINSALAAAYRKDFGEKNQNIQAEYDVETGKTKVFDVKEVVEDLTPEELEAIEKLRLEREARRDALERGEKVPEKTDEDRAKEDEIRKFNPKTEIELKDAKLVKKSSKVGDIIKTALDIPGDFGRMAAQTAKQVIIQRLREAERNVMYQTYKDKEGQILNGIVQKREGRNVLVDLDHATAILPAQEQIRFEKYNIGDRMKFYLMSVELTTRGPELIVSRAHPDIIDQLFKIEIPEISSGVIEIKAIAREAGSRAKVAVYTKDGNIDPIGSCIGQRGARIQTIINELSGEKIDIIEYNDKPEKFIANSLMPAKATKVELNDETKEATVTVPAEQLSLTIGKEGQNVRLASKLTGWKLTIKEGNKKEEKSETGEEKAEEKVEEKAEEKKTEKVEDKVEEK